MDSYDRLSSLPDLVLVMILSQLTFKECVRTSAFGKRWRNLYRETRNIAFDESEYVGRVDERTRETARFCFVCFMCRWIRNFQGQVIETFEISFSNPLEYWMEMDLLINFAVSKKVKNLLIDFSSPKWSTFSDAQRCDDIYQLPASVYNHTSLVLLKLYGCRFDPTKFVNTGLLNSLFIGWTYLRDVETLIENSPLLEKLSISYCWGLDIVDIAGNMKEFAFENCEFPFMSCAFDLPSIDVFKYMGDVFCFHFERMNKVIREVYLDFKSEGEYDVSTMATQTSGEVICGYMNSLRAAVTLSVCPFLLQSIPESEPPHLLHPLEIKHLVLRTRLHPKEFFGIKMLLHNCPQLETLTFDIQSPNPYEKSFTYAGINPQTFWLDDQTFSCQKKTLKVVVVKNFVGRPNEVNVLRYMIRYGYVLEKVDIYLRDGLDDKQMMVARAEAFVLQSMPYRVPVLVHNP